MGCVCSLPTSMKSAAAFFRNTLIIVIIVTHFGAFLL